MKEKILDGYVKWALLYDLLIIVAVMTIVYVKKDAFFIPEERNAIDNLISNIISTIVSFTGFILASLTIIVTVKANVKIKSLEEAANGMELILATENYKKIITAFKDAIIELVLALLLLYVSWMPIVNLNSLHLSLLAILGISVIILSVARTLLILFAIIFLEFT
jgi:hypothetical protein